MRFDRLSITRTAAVIAGLALTLSVSVRADFVFLADGNVIELKDVHPATKAAAGTRGKDSQAVEGTDEKGETRTFDVAELDKKSATPIIKDKTSWEKKADNLKWYEGNVLKIADNWQAQLGFGRSCKDRSMFEESFFHFKKAYELRAASPLDAGETEEQRHRTLALFLEKDCGLLDEAVNEYAKVYEKIKEQPKDAEAHRKMAQWCISHDLPDAADLEYKTAIATGADKKIMYEKEYKQFQRSLIVPLNRQMYDRLAPNIDAACKYLRKNEFINPDGSMGKDAVEAGVQTIRGMTALAAEALLCEWDLKFFKDPESAGKPPKEIADAITYLCSDKDHGRHMGGDFLGDDLWGPALTLQFFVRAYSRPYLADRRPEMAKAMDLAIADLKKLQRSTDGGWNYYNFIQNSASFLSAAILINLNAAKNLGFTVDPQMIEKAKNYLDSAKFGEGVYKYSVEKYEERGTNRSFSAVGACARSPLCEMAVMTSGGGTQQSLKQAITNFFNGHDFLWKLRGSNRTHTGQGRTAPYYYMFSHFWTSRCINELPRQYRSNMQNYMAVYITTSQDPDGTFHDFTGTKAYKLYATALGVLAMHELISAEPDIAFTAPKTAKFESNFETKPEPTSPSDVPEKKELTKPAPPKDPAKSDSKDIKKEEKK